MTGEHDISQSIKSARISRVTEITPQLAFRKKDGRSVYFNGDVPVASCTIKYRYPLIRWPHQFTRQRHLRLPASLRLRLR
jgi:hypothetical protein